MLKAIANFLEIITFGATMVLLVGRIIGGIIYFSLQKLRGF